MEIRQIPRFERQNPDISVNVFCMDKKHVIPRYVASYTDRKHHVNLLLLTKGEKKHYILVVDRSSLVAGRSKSTNAIHLCYYCLRPFKSEDAFKGHLDNCKLHQPTATTYPTVDNNKLTWTGKRNCFKQSFTIIADFESLLVKPSDCASTSKTSVINNHEVCAVAA